MEKYIKNGNKKIKFKTVTKFTDRLKGFRFYLYPIKEGLCYPKKKMINTYFVCQKLDIVVTDKENIEAECSPDNKDCGKKPISNRFPFPDPAYGTPPEEV